METEALEQAFIECLLHPRCFTHINSFNPSNNPCGCAIDIILPTLVRQRLRENN